MRSRRIPFPPNIFVLGPFGLHCSSASHNRAAGIFSNNTVAFVRGRMVVIVVQYTPSLF